MYFMWVAAFILLVMNNVYGSTISHIDYRPQWMENNVLSIRVWEEHPDCRVGMLFSHSNWK